MESLFNDNASGAVISDCGQYRYQLWRTWDESKPKVLFIMLNPSTADHNTDDRTIRRCIGFAKSWGYGGIMVGNLYAYRATKPKKLFKHIVERKHQCTSDPDNAENIVEMLLKCNKMVYAWGTNGNKYFRGREFVSTLPDGYFIELSKDGTPKHPLYLKGDLKLEKYIPEERVVIK